MARSLKPFFDWLVGAPTPPPRTLTVVRLAVDMAPGFLLRAANGVALTPGQYAIGLGAPLDLADTTLFGHQTSVLVPGQLAGTTSTLNAVPLPVLPGIEVSPRIPIMPETGRRGGDQQAGSN
jgi:hypothetical protein